ncbi:MAG TPA: hypothetical protein PLZ51_04085, partial [Aggregatilineales bacterium]|nr:hypothetical protein [Aggregatilineales bacterium]
ALSSHFVGQLPLVVINSNHVNGLCACLASISIEIVGIQKGHVAMPFNFDIFISVRQFPLALC